MFSQEMNFYKSSLSPQALAVLQSYNYPGNIRELKNIIENALIRSSGKSIKPEHLNLINTHTNQKIKSTVKPSSLSNEQAILSYVGLHGNINNKQCREYLDLSFEQASYLLGKLQRQGLLEQTGQKRWSCYQLPTK